MKRTLKNKIAAPLLIAGLLVSTVAVAAPPIWRNVAPGAIPAAGPRLIQPLKARTFAMDMDALQATLRKAPGENVIGAVRPTLRLPMPGRGEMRFRIVESSVMQPGLAAKFPQIRTFAGTSVTDPSITGRFQIDPRGFRAMIFTSTGTAYIDPYRRGDNRHYQVYYSKDLPAKRRAPDVVLPAAKARAGSSRRGVSIANELRTYRVAIGATYEYSMFHDPKLPPAFPDKAVVLAELVNVVNRVGGVYERDLGIRMVLIDGNENAIYNTPAQPYVDQVGPAMVEINTMVLDDNVGNENYDIGHVASTGGGGIAGLGVVCNTSQKGAGVTGLPEPVGDAYYIDFVAHEMGHQFGANHTFNGDEPTNCGPNANSSTAYEPGSGITIMGYAGVCSGQNLAPHSIDTFHGASFDEIVDYTRHGEGDTCGVKTAIANNPPAADAGVGGFTIPKQTPFELTGASCDADDDAITYQWEEFDLGPRGTPDGGATTSAPIFRDFLPTTSPTRVFPQPSDLLGNVHSMGEILPNTDRAMKFRLTVRDNKQFPLSGGVGSDDLEFAVTAAAGPFLITYPNSAETYVGLLPMQLSWNVAGTDVAPVSCAKVNVMFSSDGGLTFPTTLAAATPNDGAEEVTVPNLATTAARLKVKCADNVFFDVNDSNFIIEPVTTNPDPFTFVDRSGVRGGRRIASQAVTIAGITGHALLSIAGGSYRVNDEPYMRRPRLVEAGDQIRVAVLSAAGEGVTVSATLTVGGVADSFDVTTLDPPDAFHFVGRTGVRSGRVITSAPVTLGGFNGTATISIAGGTFSINGGDYQRVRGHVSSGDSVRIRLPSSAQPATTTTATLTVGGVADSFQVTTAP